MPQAQISLRQEPGFTKRLATEVAPMPPTPPWIRLAVIEDLVETLEQRYRRDVGVPKSTALIEHGHRLLNLGVELYLLIRPHSANSSAGNQVREVSGV